jgi:hypothetical protein
MSNFYDQPSLKRGSQFLLALIQRFPKGDSAGALWNFAGTIVERLY